MGAVLGELVVLVEGVAQPGVAGGVPPPAHAAVDVGGDGDGPARELPGGVAVAVAGVVEAGAGEFGPRGQLGQAVVGEGVEAVGEGGPVGHPVIHLEVDVGVVVAHPVRVVAVEPQALEVQRQTAARAGDHQVAPELQVGRFEFGVGRVVGVPCPDPLPGVHASLQGAGCAERHVHALEQLAVVGDMGVQQGGRGVFGGVEDLTAGQPARVERRGAVAGGRVGRVVRAACDDHRQASAVPEGDPRPDDGDGPAAAVRGDGRPVPQPVRELCTEGSVPARPRARGGLAVGAVQADVAAVAPAAVLGEVQDDDVVGPAGEHLASVRHAGAHVGGRDQALAEVEGAPVPGDGREVVVGMSTVSLPSRVNDPKFSRA